MKSGLGVSGVFHIWCHRPDGSLFRYRRAGNLVTDVGLNLIRDWMINQTALITEWRFIPMAAGASVSVDDTYASHAGWDEFEDYDEPERPTWAGFDHPDDVGVATNVGFEGELTMTDTAELGGIALCGGGAEPETKGDTAGNSFLFSAAAITDTEFPAGFTVTIMYVLTFSRAA